VDAGVSCGGMPYGGVGDCAPGVRRDARPRPAGPQRGHPAPDRSRGRHLGVDRPPVGDLHQPGRPGPPVPPADPGGARPRRSRHRRHRHLRRRVRPPALRAALQRHEGGPPPGGWWRAVRRR